MSKLGVCSRKEAVRRVEAGRVSVNGRVARLPSRRVDLARDLLAVDGCPVREADVRRLVLAFHKPKGVVTTRTDPGGRPTVYDHLKDVERWVFPVGRLDRDSSGLLILTNDHRLSHRLTDPAHKAPKRYHALVAGVPPPEALNALRHGIDIGDPELTRPARIRIVGSSRAGATWLEIELTEGRNRQIRRMCAAVGHDVRELVRVAVGSLTLDDLAVGAWRRLSPDEIGRLENA